MPVKDVGANKAAPAEQAMDIVKERTKEDVRVEAEQEADKLRE